MNDACVARPVPGPSQAKTTDDEYIGFPCTAAATWS